MQFTIELTSADLRRLVILHLANIVKEDFEPEDVVIEVKTSRNYRAEWEPGEFRVRLLVNR